MGERGYYVLDAHLDPVRPGSSGELYLADRLLSGEYYDTVATTADRLVADPFAGPERRMYRTGELVLLTEDGQLLPAGPPRDPRAGQVEFALASYPGARHAAAAVRDGSAGEPGSVAAYLVLERPGPDPLAVHRHAAGLVAPALLPSALVLVPGLPIGAGSSVEPQLVAESDPARRQQVHALFAEVLGSADFGDEDSFLALGGQSVTAMLLVSKLNGAFGIELNIGNLFETPTVAGIEAKIAELVGVVSNPFDAAGASCTVLVDSAGRHSLWPAGQPVPDGWERVRAGGSRVDCLDYVTKHWQDGQSAPSKPSAGSTASLPPGAFPLSFNQEFFCDLGIEAGDAGSFGERHTLVGGWRLTGAVDDTALQLALDDVAERHEILRTTIQHEREPRYQVVHPPSPASLDIRTLAPSAVLSRDFQCEQLLTEIEALAFDVNDLPLVRAVLARFDDQDAVLVISLHHIAVDAWSLQVVARDLALCYARRRGFDLPLPELHQYREFCVQQRRAAESPSMQPARDYWRTALDGARIFELPTQPPAEVAPEASNYAMQSFVISGELSRAIVSYAQQTRTSPYMVMLSAFYLLARELTGNSDLVVPTLTTGRHNVTFHHTVGPFLNFLPIRTDITGCQTFAEVVARTRTNCVQAYSNEIPFECVEPEAPLLFEGAGMSGGTQMSFEMLQAPPAASDELIGDLRYAEVHRRLLFEGDCADLPAGMLWALAVVSPDEIIGSIQFKRSEFSGHAVADLVSAYSRVLRQAVSAPDEPLATFTQQPLTLELDR
jgi:uncharacterized protein YbdZ (MbtH family)/acyl carrier protein